MRERIVFGFLAGLALAGLAWAGPAASAAADVNDFTFDSFEADYYLDTDDAGRSSLRTVETLVARFPDFDQNRGIIRALVRFYDGHPVDTTVESVVDENGNPRPWHFATEEEGSGDEDFLEITLADDDFVRGVQTYVITYTQKNVTHLAADLAVDEFYWDVNGTGWAQSFGEVTSRLHIPAHLVGAYRGGESCYRGHEGSTDRCEITTEEQPDGALIVTAAAADLSAYSTVTFAVAFEAGTFTGRDESYLASPFAWLQLLAAALTAAGFGWMVRLRMTALRDARGRPTIIAEYVPPTGLTLVQAAVLLGRPKRSAGAQLIDLAVRHNIRIIETEPAWYSFKPRYTLQLLSVDGLNGSERDFLRIYFGASLTPGSEYLIRRFDSTRSQLVYYHVQSAKSSETSNGIRTRVPARRKFLPVALTLVGGVGTFIAAILLIADVRGGWLPVWLVGSCVIVIIIVVRIAARVPLASRGAELRDHMAGLRLYIRLAEADRLRVLQSPEGAERMPLSPVDPRELLRLNEKLLPYAVLFRLEKRWARELGKYYESEPPDWFAGTSGFNAGIFASSIGSLSSAAGSSYSGSSSSSSSGGSSGGGSSGGGGGGGGGGGI